MTLTMAAWRVSLKQDAFDDIMAGLQTVESRDIRNTTLGKLTRVDKATGKRYVRQPHFLRLYTSYDRSHDAMLVKVIQTEFRKPNEVFYHLGDIIEYDIKKTTADRIERLKEKGIVDN